MSETMDPNSLASAILGLMDVWDKEARNGSDPVDKIINDTITLCASQVRECVAIALSPDPVVAKPDAPVWSDWIPWAGGECPILWAKAGEWGWRWEPEREFGSNNVGRCEVVTGIGAKTAWPLGLHGKLFFYRYRLDRAPKASDSPVSSYTMCGGCGAKTPMDRCIGCLHDFGGVS